MTREGGGGMARARVARWRGLILLGLLVAGAAGARPAAPPVLSRALGPDEQRQVKELQALLQGHAQAGRFEDAADAARRVAELRKRAQGAGHWGAIDAALA